MKNYRYLIDIDKDELETEYHDVLIIGSGIAGVYTALSISEKHDIAILTKETIDVSNSVLAQGGIAVSLDAEDSPELHFKDTIYAGAGLCVEDSVWVLVKEAAKNIKKLCNIGVKFDRKKQGELSFGREAAHSKSRIIHAGDTTGKEVCDKLISVVKTKGNVTIKERTFALDIIVENNVCKGVIAYDEDTSKHKLYLSNVVICAMGGYGQLYSRTTNPEVATGDGAAMAYRAGATLTDMEFIQFHPTVLHHEQNKSFLISEAVRGEGAILRNINGERFMERYHELKELAPRDVVSRSIFTEMKKTGAHHVLLDITFKSREYLESRFPNIFKTCLEYGIDMSKDYIPIAPTEHYCMGGIKTDVFGRTGIAGFYACGESACTGIHGANRLASNSLLEGLVFGSKIGSEVNNVFDNTENKEIKIDFEYRTDRSEDLLDVESIKADLQELMTHNVGIMRDRQSLLIAADKVDAFYNKVMNNKVRNSKYYELKNMITLSKLVIAAAIEREESRGAHFRSDFPKTDDVNWKRHISNKLDV